MFKRMFSMIKLLSKHIFFVKKFLKINSALESIFSELFDFTNIFTNFTNISSKIMNAKDFRILECNYNFETGFNKANFRQFLSSIHLSLRQKKVFTASF